MDAKQESDSLKVQRFRDYVRGCNGSQQFFRHMLAKRMLYTEGVKELATVFGAWWLIDAIASHMATSASLQAEPFLSWSLLPEGESGAKLVATDGSDDTSIASQDIPYTDFPRELMPFKLFCEQGAAHTAEDVANGTGTALVHTLMLPEER